jgi:uncharacterized protein YkwD
LPAPPPTDRPYSEAEFLAAAHTEPHDAPAPRRRPMHPAIIASAALLATALASSVGAFTFAGPHLPTAAAATAQAGQQQIAVPPTADPFNDPAATASLGPAPTSAAQPPVGQAPAPPAQAPTPPKTTTKPPPPANKPPANSGVEGSVLDLVNQERAKNGCAALAIDPRLATAARAHSADMADRNYFAHDTPDGVGVDKRVTSAGYRWSSVGENIAKGQQTAADVMKSWMNSPGHRANILNCGYKHIGIGYVLQGRSPLWTQDFASPL